MVILQPTAISRILAFFRDNLISSFSPNKNLIISDFESAIRDRRRGVITKTPVYYSGDNGDIYKPIVSDLDKLREFVVKNLDQLLKLGRN